MINDAEFIDASENPALSAQFLESITKEEDEDTTVVSGLPLIADPDLAFTNLPAGLPVEDGGLLVEVEVNELNGADEERLAKVSQSAEAARWVQTLLECGVASIGGRRATPDLLKRLLVGDRDFLVMAIRHATYGPEVDFGVLQCPGCGEEVDVKIDIRTDIPVRKLTSEREFEVPLRNDRVALVQYPTGADQMAFFENPNITEAERKTILLAKCVIGVKDADGIFDDFYGFQVSRVKGMSIVDRNAITEAISESQPGPRYDEVKYKHECGFESPVGVDLMRLFPGL